MRKYSFIYLRALSMVIITVISFMFYLVHSIMAYYIPCPEGVPPAFLHIMNWVLLLIFLSAVYLIYKIIIKVSDLIIEVLEEVEQW